MSGGAVHIASLPDKRALARPTAPCISDEAVSLSNESFCARVHRATDVLAAHGVGNNDVVATVLPNRIELVVTLFAAWQLGAAVTPVNPALTSDEAGYQIRDSGAKVVLAEGPTSDYPGSVSLDVADLAAECGSRTEPAAPPRPDSLALLIYTSGTTGRPKGVMLDHANLTAMCEMIVSRLELDESDHSLLILPLFHVNGIVVSVLSPLLAGGQASIAGRFRAESFFPTVERFRPTYFSAVPAIYAMLTALPATVRPDTSSLRRAVCGAAPMPAELIERFEARFGVPVLEGYGLSEGTCASTLNPTDRRKPGTVGRPLPGQQVAVMGADGRLLDQGTTGEVVVRGPNVMRGYFGLPEATASTVVDGWLHTGDVGRFDEDGYLLLVDRIKDMIIRGGENLYPKEIENVLHAHPAVIEAAVVGRPDPVLGEVPVAFVALYPDAATSGEDLDRHCRASLARIKVPVDITVLDQLPKNPVGKIDKPTLRKSPAENRV
jgi:acyl-CoA synthetase (AMP-forming)/AMP-acid ligase II